jgi:hypothetical protein
MNAQYDLDRSLVDILTQLSESMQNYASLKESLLSRLEFKHLSSRASEDSTRPLRFAAVDSSSASVVDAGCFIVMAYRVGSITTIEGELHEPDELQDPAVQLALINTSEKAVGKNYKLFLEPLINSMGDIQTSPELTPPISQMRPRDVDWLQLARAVEEWRQIRILLDRLEPGDFILRDGALRADIRIPPVLVDEILKVAVERGIHIIGIVKRSSIPAASGQLMPIVPAIQQLGRMELPDSNWYTPLPLDDNEFEKYPSHFGKSYIVQYHPLSQYVFWTDINSYDSISPEIAFTKLAGLCSDPVYMGYPFPLALIHNRVVLTRAQVEDIKYKIQSSALESKIITLSEWELLFQNFHEMLDANIY